MTTSRRPSVMVSQTHQPPQVPAQCCNTNDCYKRSYKHCARCRYQATDSRAPPGPGSQFVVPSLGVRCQLQVPAYFEQSIECVGCSWSHTSIGWSSSPSCDVLGGMSPPPGVTARAMTAAVAVQASRHPYESARGHALFTSQQPTLLVSRHTWEHQGKHLITTCSTTCRFFPPLKWGARPMATE